MTNESPAYGKATPEEMRLTGYILEGLAHYTQRQPIKRRMLVSALSQICTLVFTVETPFDIKQQCEEIDDFCKFLKSQALRNAVRS